MLAESVLLLRGDALLEVYVLGVDYFVYVHVHHYHVLGLLAGVVIVVGAWASAGRGSSALGVHQRVLLILGVRKALETLSYWPRGHSLGIVIGVSIDNESPLMSLVTLSGGIGRLHYRLWVWVWIWIWILLYLLHLHILLLLLHLLLLHCFLLLFLKKLLISKILLLLLLSILLLSAVVKVILCAVFYLLLLLL